MLNEFMKLGQVVEVRGQKIRIRVFENKNGPILLYQGNIIKNVSVGSFIKIPKGYISIIGKIEGEHISELKEKNAAADRFQKESDSIERMIDVSVLGVMEKGVFVKGIMEIPLVFSDAYILEEHELQRVFSFFENEEKAIPLGNIAEYKNYKIYVDAQLLFASHIGIFGNTGSGKSNTLATIYTALFQKFEKKKNFHKSTFLVFDFNGEYGNTFTEKKKVYELSTRQEDKDKIEIPMACLGDIHFWNILCEASAKIQQPFLERVIMLYQELGRSREKGTKAFLTFLRKKLQDLLLYCYREGENTTENRRALLELFAVILVDTDEFHVLDLLIRRLYQPKEGEAYQNQEFHDKQFVSFLTKPALDLITEKNLKSPNGFDYFTFAMKYREILETAQSMGQQQQIKSLIRRYEMHSLYLKRLFLPVQEVTYSDNVEIFSLLDVHGDLKKLVPAALCSIYYEKQKKTREGSLHIIIDEAHDILNAKKEKEDAVWKDHSLELFEEMVKEGRKFGTFLTISSQRPSDISEGILSQMHNYFIHRTANKNDVQAIERAVVFLDEGCFQTLPVLPQGNCIFAGAASNFPVMVRMDMTQREYMLSSDTIDLIQFWCGEEESQQQRDD